jgi:taurine dioxygenase
MSYQTIEVRKLTPTIGAEIHGIDLSHPLGNQQFQEVHDALMDNLVIFFRDQNLTIDQHKDFGRRFGKLHFHPNAPKLIEEHPEILVIRADEKSKHVAGEEWHSDVSCDAEPPMGSILYMHEPAANGGGDTMFANMYAAYEALSDSMKRYLEGLTAIHDSTKAHTHRRRDGASDQQFPQAEHPVIRTHPVTQRKLLFVNRGFTTRIASSSATRAMRCSRCCSVMSRRRSSTAASNGRSTRWRSGTIAAASTRRCSTTGRTAATPIVSRCAAISRISERSLFSHSGRAKREPGIQRLEAQSPSHRDSGFVCFASAPE